MTFQDKIFFHFREITGLGCFLFVCEVSIFWINIDYDYIL